jgi:hypothetical protein
MVNYIYMDVESYDKLGEWEAKIILERNSCQDSRNWSIHGHNWKRSGSYDSLSKWITSKSCFMIIMSL